MKWMKVRGGAPGALAVDSAVYSLSTTRSPIWAVPTTIDPSTPAFSAICAHKLMYPTPQISFIGVRKGIAGEEGIVENVRLRSGGRITERVIETREVRPIGASRSIPFDVRIVSATHRDLAARLRRQGQAV